ncbi:MAG: MerR family transcriptional regulator [Solirubrobacterales bacterium]|nr:MerR family transcriptional regulator [Solirubrobacterales bacterium]
MELALHETELDPTQGEQGKPDLRAVSTGGDAGSPPGATDTSYPDTIRPGAFAEATGMSKERLRMWERRYGFPSVFRASDGSRRYSQAEIALVTKVREAADAGMPIPQAIDSVRASVDSTTPTNSTLLSSIATNLPIPLLLVGGEPKPRLWWGNAAFEEVSSIKVGDELATQLPWFTGSELHIALERVRADPTRVEEVIHPAWSGEEGQVTSAIFHLGPDAGPVVALITGDPSPAEADAVEPAPQSDAPVEQATPDLVAATIPEAPQPATSPAPWIAPSGQAGTTTAAPTLSAAARAAVLSPLGRKISDQAKREFSAALRSVSKHLH